MKSLWASVYTNEKLWRGLNPLNHILGYDTVTIDIDNGFWIVSTIYTVYTIQYTIVQCPYIIFYKILENTIQKFHNKILKFQEFYEQPNGFMMKMQLVLQTT